MSEQLTVESAAAALETLAGRPAAEHVAVYDELHAVLQEALAGIDER